MQVFVSVIPGPRRAVTVNDGANVNAALQALSVSTANSEIRLNNMVVQGTEPIRDGDEIFVVQKVKGNEIV